MSNLTLATTMYVATTGSDTTGNGTFNAPFATIQRALDELNGKTLVGYVTIQLADGIYSCASQVTIDHPQANLITIQGNTSDKTEVTLNFTDCHGFYIPASSLNSTIKYLTISGNDNNLYSGVYVNGQCTVNNCTINNFAGGILVDMGSALASDDISITSCLGAGVVAQNSGYAYCYDCDCTGNFYGFQAHCNGTVFIDEYCTGTNNTSYGVHVDMQSVVKMKNSSSISFSFNTTGAFGCTTHSLIVATGVTYSGSTSPSINTEGNYGSWIIV